VRTTDRTPTGPGSLPRAAGAAAKKPIQPYAFVGSPGRRAVPPCQLYHRRFARLHQRRTTRSSRTAHSMTPRTSKCGSRPLIHDEAQSLPAGAAGYRRCPEVDATLSSYLTIERSDRVTGLKHPVWKREGSPPWTHKLCEVINSRLEYWSLPMTGGGGIVPNSSFAELRKRRKDTTIRNLKKMRP
jgi:hypothetical protein